VSLTELDIKSLKPARRCGHRILYFHQIATEKVAWYNGGISPERFYELLEAVQRLGFRFISLEEALFSKTPLKGTASLCSDDGLATNYNVMPVLDSLGIKLTLFLIGKCIDNGSFAWNHRLALLRARVRDVSLKAILPELQSLFNLKDMGNISSTLFGVAQDRRDELIDWLWERFQLPSSEELVQTARPFLGVDQLREMSSRGVALALHSHSHADLSRLAYPELKQELLLNIAALECYKLPWQPWLAFPYGRQVSKEYMLRLRGELGIQRFLGIRFVTGDNRPNELLWQRIGLETDGFTPWREMLLKPVARRLKGAFSNR
jgi:peptidoglycan/xylan/chitin deacetylase (PgdA/CDA1 family)